MLSRRARHHGNANLPIDGGSGAIQENGIPGTFLEERRR